MVREDLIGHTRNGIEYIRGNNKVIFETGVVIPLSEFEAAEKLGTLGGILLEYKFNPEHSGFDYAYCKSTGIIRKKAVHKTEPKPEVKETEETAQELPDAVEESTEVIVAKTNWFDWAYPKIMLALSLICTTLSIYFTGTYMQDLQPAPVAYFISVSMLLYGLVGTQMARRAWKSRRFLKSFIFGVTSVCTIGFSMYTALDVNYRKYASNHTEVLKEDVAKQNNGVEFEIIREELESNKAQIEVLSKTYVVMWDGEKNSNVVVEGKVTEKAQNQINELTARNRELNARLVELAQSGAVTEQKETDKAESISSLFGALLNISGNIVQMLILMLPSIFIDLVNVLSITIYNDSCSSDKED